MAPTLRDLIPDDVLAQYPDSALTPKARKILSLPAPSTLSPEDTKKVSAALVSALPTYTVSARSQRVAAKPIMRQSQSPDDVVPTGPATAPGSPQATPSWMTEASAKANAVVPSQGRLGVAAVRARDPVTAALELASGVGVGAGRMAEDFVRSIPGQVKQFYGQASQSPEVPGEPASETQARGAGYQDAARSIAGYTPLETVVGPVLPLMVAQGGAGLLQAGAPVETAGGQRPPTAAEVGGRIGEAGSSLAMGLPGLVHGAISRFKPKPEEAAAALANVITPDGIPPHLVEVSKQVSGQLAETIDQLQKTSNGPLGFKTGDISIQDAHIVPTLVRYFPGDLDPLRVTVVDNATGDMHSIRMSGIPALRQALDLGPPRELPASLATPASPELPAPSPVTTKYTVPGEIVSPEAIAAGKADRADRIANVGAKVAANVSSALDRLRTAPAAIEALQRQIAENPGDARIGRWKRRLEKLKALPPPEVTKAAPGLAEQPAREAVVKGVPSQEAAPAPAPIQKAGTAEPVPATGKVVRAKPGAPTAPAAPPEPAPKPPRRELGKFERGDRVTAVAGSEKGRGSGFVLESRGAGGEARLRVRWDGGRESAEVAKNLRVRVGSARATEAEVAKIEAVEQPTIPRSYKKGEEPPPRPDVEGEVAAAMRKRAGLRPIKETPFKPTKGFVAENAMATDKYVTDGHIMLVASEMDPKIRERLAGVAAEGSRQAPSEKGFQHVIDDATKGPSVRLLARGVATVAQDGGERDYAVFHDPKSGRTVMVDPQKLKMAVKAVSPDTYEQMAGARTTETVKGKVTITAAEHRPIVMKRGGKLVGLMMPLRATDGEAAEIRGMLGRPAEMVTHESRMSGAPMVRPPKPSAGRGIPIARTAPRIPTEAEAATLPTTTVPPFPQELKSSPLAGAIKKVGEALHELVAFTNPVRFAVGPNLDMLMKAKGTIKQALFRSEQAQKSVLKFWEKRTRDEVLDFWNRFESGHPADPRLAEIAKMYRQRADNMFKAISRFKQIPYWENWFPHMWKDPEQAKVYFAGRRPMEGGKAFLKARVFEDIMSGIKSGLEPVSWNPEELMQAAEHSARKYVMVQELLKDYLESGAMKLVRVGQSMPEGYRRVDQNWARLYLNPEIAVKEAFDAHVMGGLEKVAKSIGTKLDRKVRIGGKMLGYSKSAPGRTGEVVTRFATPESVLAHEIGHQIDSKYDLQSTFLRVPKATGRGSGKANAERIAMLRELRALADLRGTEDSPAHYKAYIRSAPEKMAVMLEALIHTPEEFKRVAPLNYQKLIAFLSSKPELAPLVDLRPSLHYGEGVGTVSAGGIVLGGDYVAEENLARILDNHMSKDWVADSKLGKGIMDSRNFLNALNLGLSAFHATGTTMLSMMSRMGVGISETAHGLAGKGPGMASGMWKIATSPAAPIMYARTGWKFYRGAPELAEMEEHLFTGGASLESKQYYKSQMLDRFVRNGRRALSHGTLYERLGGAGKATIQAPFAAVEAPMRLLTTKYIPQMKVGAFRDLFSSQLRIKAEDIASGKTSEADVARIAWRDVEDRFGLINYDNEFWNNTLKSSIMVLIRAPGWTLGTLRALGGAGFVDLPRFAASPLRGKAPEWTSRMSFAMSMTFTTMAAGAIYHYLHTGKPPETLEDYLHPKNGLTDSTGKPERVDFPTFMKDVKAWSQDPVKAAFGKIQHGRGASSIGHGGKLAPEITLFLDFLENQSNRGPIRNVQDPAYKQALQFMLYVFGREQPFSIQQARATIKERGGTEGVGEQFIGITPHREAVKQRRFRYREQRQ